MQHAFASTEQLLLMERMSYIEALANCHITGDRNTPGLGTTVIHSNFFQILQVSLPNSVAHPGKFSIYSN